MLSHVEIEARLPHKGSMCLLERVTAWDATSIVCRGAALTATHPLALAQGVPVVAAVEYAAQAAALHGALLNGDSGPRSGMLAKVNDVELTGSWLAKGSGPLHVRADLLVRGDRGCMYSFTVRDEHGCGACGRLLVALANDR